MPGCEARLYQRDYEEIIDGVNMDSRFECSRRVGVLRVARMLQKCWEIESCLNVGGELGD